MKAAIIGAAGSLGSATAFYLGIQGLCSEIKLIDIKRNVAESHVMDLYQGLLEDTHVRFTLADYSDIGDCDIIIITASVPYNNKAKDRTANLVTNYKIVESICAELKKYRKSDSIIITGTNPIEVYTYAYAKLLGCERNRVIGFCAPDTIRMKWAIEEVTGMEYDQLDCHCVGEHGYAVRLYEQATCAGRHFELTEEQRSEVERMNVEWFEHWRLLDCGRTTGWTSSIHIGKIVEAIVNNNRAVLPAAVVMEGEYGFEGVALDMVCRIGRNGIEEIIDMDFTDEQLEALRKTEVKLKGMQAQAGLD